MKTAKMTFLKPFEIIVFKFLRASVVQNLVTLNFRCGPKRPAFYIMNLKKQENRPLARNGQKWVPNIVFTIE